jgi:hypothetical protein
MNAPAPKRRSATALIVVIVLAVACIPCTGILAAIGIPSFIGYVRRSKTLEARANIRAIAAGVEAAHGIHGVLPQSLPRTPAVPGVERRAWPADADPRWSSDLGWAPAEPLYYAYEYTRDPAGDGFVVRAYGDLDGDSMESIYEIRGRVVGEDVDVDFQPTVTNELE